MQERKVQRLFGRYGGMASEGRNCNASKDEHLREEHSAAHQTHAAFYLFHVKVSCSEQEDNAHDRCF